MKWVRATDGAIFGVCKGLSKTLDMPLGLFRLVWLISIFFGGAGILVYFMLALSLPREDKQVQALEPRLLGVCSRVALRADLEVGIVRFLALCLLFVSLGSVLVGYVVLYFVVDANNSVSTRNRSL